MEKNFDNNFNNYYVHIKFSIDILETVYGAKKALDLHIYMIEILRDLIPKDENITQINIFSYEGFKTIEKAKEFCFLLKEKLLDENSQRSIPIPIRYLEISTSKKIFRYEGDISIPVYTKANVSIKYLLETKKEMIKLDNDLYVFEKITSQNHHIKESMYDIFMGEYYLCICCVNNVKDYVSFIDNKCIAFSVDGDEILSLWDKEYNWKELLPYVKYGSVIKHDNVVYLKYLSSFDGKSRTKLEDKYQNALENYCKNYVPVIFVSDKKDTVILEGEDTVISEEKDTVVFDIITPENTSSDLNKRVKYNEDKIKEISEKIKFLINLK